MTYTHTQVIQKEGRPEQGVSRVNPATLAENRTAKRQRVT